MPAPSAATYSAAAITAAHTALLALLDAGSTGGVLRLLSASDVLLATVQLSDPSGSVNSSTGQLTLAPSAAANAVASGTAAYAQLCDSALTVIASIPAQAGSTAVSGYVTLTSLTIVSGAPVEVVSAVIG